MDLIGVEHRIYKKALSNNLAIAVGSGCSPSHCSIPNLLKALENEFQHHRNSIENPYYVWDEFIDSLSNKTGAQKVIRKIREIVGNPEPKIILHNIAAIPISNFIDLTFDRSLEKALTMAGKQPILYDWTEGRIGSWKQSSPLTPNLFFMLPKLDPKSWGLTPRLPVHNLPHYTFVIENIREMLGNKDLLLVGISPEEAHEVLQIFNFSMAVDKIYIDQKEGLSRADIWATYSGTIMQSPINTLIQKLIPSLGTSFSSWDRLFPNKMFIDIAKNNSNDAFISYFHGDKPFANRLKSQLEIRDVTVWIDEKEIQIGDSFFEKINEGLSDSYTFIIIMSPESLEREWVKRELASAYALSLAGKIRLLPVVHQECEIPALMGDIKYADFRDEKRFDEQIETLTYSIKTAVAKARGKH